MTRFTLRPITEQDAALIYEARHAPHVLPYMVNQQPIAWDTHAQWMRRRVACLHQTPYAMFLEGTQPIGLAGLSSYDEAQAQAEWGFYIFGLTAARGSGRVMMAAFADFLFTHKHLQCLHASVLIGNTRSAKLHEALGFALTGRDDMLLHYDLHKPHWQGIRKHLASLIENVDSRPMESIS